MLRLLVKRFDEVIKIRSIEAIIRLKDIKISNRNEAYILKRQQTRLDVARLIL